jgi:hypothetical protein
MNLINDISECFKTKFTIARIEDKFIEFYVEFHSNNILLPDEKGIEENLKKINFRDDFEIELTLGNSATLTFQKENLSVKKIVSDIQNQLQFYSPGDSVILKITIAKLTVNSILSIYSFSRFQRFLSNLSIEDFLINFSPYIKGEGFLVFECFDLVNQFNSKSIYFQPGPITENINYSSSFLREERLAKIYSNTTFSFPLAIEILSEDFFLKTEGNLNKRVVNIFNKVASALFISSLFDITKIEKNKIEYKLNGYKAISGVVQISMPLESINEYKEIYDWIFEGGNLNDKFGLARNIISLHLSNKDLELSVNTFASVISSHKVYEKQNIKQYIELRNKITDLIQSYTEKANKIIENFAIGFQKSALAFISLFSTIVITKVLTTKTFNNIFTYDATIISFLFLVGSIIYFFVSLWEVNAQLKRFADSYGYMKLRNTDLLNESDITKILNNDEEHIGDIKFIKNKRCIYSLMWISFLVLFSAVTLFLHYKYYKSNPAENSLFKNSSNTLKSTDSAKKKSIFLWFLF